MSTIFSPGILPSSCEGEGEDHGEREGEGDDQGEREGEDEGERACWCL